MSSVSEQNESRLGSALLLLQRYTVEISHTLERVLGPELTSNHDVQIVVRLSEVRTERPPGLQAVTGLSRGSVVRVVNSLEKAGVVQRSTSGRDRRGVEISLAPAGRALATAMRSVFEDHFAASAPVVKDLIELLDPTGSGRSAAEQDEVSRASTERDVLEVVKELASVGQMITDRSLAAVEQYGVEGRAQHQTLAALLVWHGARPGQLGDLLDLSSGGITYLVDHLEHVGLVSRTYGDVADDRRSVLVTLTERGREAARTIVSAFGEFEDELLAVLIRLLPTSR